MKGCRVMLVGTYRLETEDRASGRFETLSSPSLDTRSRQTGSWTRSCARHPDSGVEKLDWRRATNDGQSLTVKPRQGRAAANANPNVHKRDAVRICKRVHADGWTQCHALHSSGLQIALWAATVSGHRLPTDREKLLD